ncbi:MAG: ATPase [Dehalococcoidia bacterium]|nr:ATPase [Dehalococcoidia bacterium]
MADKGSGKLVVSTPSDTEIVLTRTFAAPAAVVFEAWTTPEHVRNWWGLRNSQMVVCEIDLRVGGRWRYVTRESDGTEVAFNGEYQEIDAPTRIVNTEVFEMFPDNGSLITNTFEERDGQTTLTQTCVYESREVRDMVIESGMEDGADQSMDRLEEVIQTMRTRA